MLERKEPFSIRLKKVMEEKNIKAVDLAKAIGVTEGTISQYKSGYTEPKRDRLTAIANYLHVSPTWLMGIDEYPDDFNDRTIARFTKYAELIPMMNKYIELSERDKQTVSTLIDTLSK